MFSGDDLNRRGFLKAASLSIGTASILPTIGAPKEASGPSLVQRLGYPPDARLLIITADEFGECHAANVGIIQCWEAGLVNSVTWLAPASWAPEALDYIRKHPGMDVGVHLAVTGAVGSGTAGMGWRLA